MAGCLSYHSQCRVVAVFCFAATVILQANFVLGSSLVGPGAVTSFTGGGGGRSRGFGYVRDPAAGFFIAGSAIGELNGIYVRFSPSSPHTEEAKAATELHDFKLAYLNVITGWVLGLAAGPADASAYEVEGGKSTEWLILSKKGRFDMFAHEGDTVIPGSGTSWRHVHRPAPYGPEGTASTIDHDDDVEDLPWQVIYIGSENTLRDLIRRARWNEHVKQQAIQGKVLDENHRFKLLGRMHQAPNCSSAEERAPPSQIQDRIAEAGAPMNKLCADGQFTDAAGKWSEFLKNTLPEDRWLLGAAHLERAKVLHRARAFEEADISMGKLLEMHPCFIDAMIENAKLYLDWGHPESALHIAEEILRAYPDADVKTLLIQASADERRQRVAIQAAETENAISDVSFEDDSNMLASYSYYTFMGLNRDFTDKQLTRAYRKMSRKLHPDAKGGSDRLFARLAKANEVLSNPKLRREYNEGETLERETLSDGSLGDSHKTRVLKKYFPDEFGWHPFGDPFERKRAYEERETQKKRKLDAASATNDDGIPPGTYRSSCNGCTLLADGAVLLCKFCLTERLQYAESKIEINSCAVADVIGNYNGELRCERAAGSDDHKEL